MTTSPASQPESVSSFRLVGELAGRGLSFPLAIGEQIIGSGSRAAIQIAAPSVSRRHAALVVTSQEVTLTDLGSKNGTFMNGRPIVACRINIGDEVRCGPVTLKLESMDPGDGVLGLDLSPRESEKHERHSASTFEGSTLFAVDGSGPDPRLFEIMDVFIGHVVTSDQEPDWSAALSSLLEAIGASAAALVEWRREPVVLAAAGSLGLLPEASELRRFATDLPAQGFLSVLEPPAPNALLWTGIIAESLEQPLGILLQGAFPGRRATLPLLRTLLRISLSFRQASLSDLQLQESSTGPGELVFPEGILVGESPAMRRLYGEMVPLIQGDLPVLVVGETGVGKEHLAKTLHLSSARCEGPFVAINCAAIPAELLEAELFGIGKGVATGVQPRLGTFREAAGGTLFLDEVGDMPAPLQAKLLRALQEKEIQPLGMAPATIDVRVVAATNATLQTRIEEGSFRADLFYRLAGFVLNVPSLRERRHDLPRLIAHFMRQSASEVGTVPRGVTVKALEQLTAYLWPGNVRELEHEVRRLTYLCADGQAIDSEMLAAAVRMAKRVDPAEQETLEDSQDLALEPRVEALERRLIREALRRSAGNQSKAARLLDVSRNGLAYRLERLSIDASDFA